MCGKREPLDKAAHSRKNIGKRKHISVHLICLGAVFATQFRWLRWVTLGFCIVISGITARAAPGGERQAQTEHRRRTAKSHKNPAEHAKVAPKKKRPTVSHKPAMNHSAASPHKVATRKRRAHAANHAASTTHPLAAPAAHRTEPIRDFRNPADPKTHRTEPVRDFRDPSPAAVEKPRAVNAPESAPKTKEAASRAAVVPPTPPKQPEVPTVQAPSTPNAPSSDKAAD